MKHLLAITCACFFILSSNAQELSFEQQKELAEHWAPIHYQSIRKTDSPFNSNSLKGKSDSLSTMDFDNDWIATNNWENLRKYDSDPAVYYYVAATSTHYFITYGYFHPRDWTRFNLFHLGQHENDLEGALFVVERDSSKWGKLLIGYSVFHLSLKRNFYCEDDSIFHSSSERYLPGLMEQGHPVSYQQPRGHGVKLEPSFHKPNRSYCRYIPAILNESDDHDKKYRLINLLDSNQLIHQRNNENFFNDDQTIKGSKGEGANPPWLWRDWTDSKKKRDIQVFIDPANYVLIDNVFSLHYSTEYTHHPYLNIIESDNQIP